MRVSHCTLRQRAQKQPSQNRENLRTKCPRHFLLFTPGIRSQLQQYSSCSTWYRTAVSSSTWYRTAVSKRRFLSTPHRSNCTSLLLLSQQDQSTQRDIGIILVSCAAGVVGHVCCFALARRRSNKNASAALEIRGPVIKREHESHLICIMENGLS